MRTARGAAGWSPAAERVRRSRPARLATAAARAGTRSSGLSAQRARSERGCPCRGATGAATHDPWSTAGPTTRFALRWSGGAAPCRGFAPGGAVGSGCRDVRCRPSSSASVVGALACPAGGELVQRGARSSPANAEASAGAAWNYGAGIVADWPRGRSFEQCDDARVEARPFGSVGEPQRREGHGTSRFGH
jgi:hypothetical protein